MKLYKIELRHAPSKNRLNATRHNRLAPQVVRHPGDDEAIAWTRLRLVRYCTEMLAGGSRYFEAAVFELGGGEDSRRIGRWVVNPSGVNWRPSAPQG